MDTSWLKLSTQGRPSSVGQGINLINGTMSLRGLPRVNKGKRVQLGISVEYFVSFVKSGGHHLFRWKKDCMG